MWPPLSNIVYSKSSCLIVKLGQMHEEIDPFHSQSLATCRGKKSINSWTILVSQFEYLLWDCWTIFPSNNKFKSNLIDSVILRVGKLYNRQKSLKEDVGFFFPSYILDKSEKIKVSLSLDFHEILFHSSFTMFGFSVRPVIFIRSSTVKYMWQFWQNKTAKY